MELRVHDSIAEIPQPAWDALLDESATPFLRWHWLEAMETSGCATAETGWTACHLSLWRGKELVAAAPAYFKSDSDGDFSRDWGWAQGVENAGIRYYPKLSLTVPFTPCTGRRILVRAGEDRADCVRRVVAGAVDLARRARCSSLHVLFPQADEADELAAAGMAKRVSYQYHWRNANYASFDDFLARFDSKK
ncbi:MAG TPA: peptidogalycan biosysnthesis protein, partial [Polyangia bacterium]|nr:peptidogalycan biosysnthesis protein [Polyangia bacterium]